MATSGRARSAAAGLAVAIGIMTVSVSSAQAEETARTEPRGPAADRDRMVSSFDREFRDEWTEPAHGWTGNVASCTPGITSQSFRDAMRSRVNWYRSLTGLALVSEGASMTRHAQASALMSAAAGVLSHQPGLDWPCYSSDGATGAGTSNLSLGTFGTGSVDSQMRDAGSNNAGVGHRRWLLDPAADEFGFGSVPAAGGHMSAGSIAVIPGEYRDRSAVGVPDGVVAWPPAGHVPVHVVWPRWSLAVVDGTRLDGTRVEVAVNGRPVAAPVEIVDNTGYGGSSAVTFLPDLSALEAPGDDVFDVTVTDAGRTWSYQVVVVDLSPAPARGFAGKLVEDFLGVASPSFTQVESIASRLEGPWTPRAPIVEELTLSPEWAGAVVDEFYLDTLDRRADPSGRAYWVGILRSGVPVANVAAGFYGSTEYVRAHGPALSGWIDELYRVLLGRSADPSGRSFWEARATATSPAAVAFEFYQSVESRQNRVIDLYDALLDRVPDAAGLRFWTRALAGGDDLALARELGASEEYFRAP